MTGTYGVSVRDEENITQYQKKFLKKLLLK